MSCHGVSGGEPEEASQFSQTLQTYGWPLGTTEATAKAVFPTATQVVIGDDTEWYLRTVAVVFPTAEAAREDAEGETKEAVEGVGLLLMGVRWAQ